MKIICIGRNYARHAAEMGSPLPRQPLVFHKPSTALLSGSKPFYYPEFSQEIHHEIEIVLKICKNGRHVQPDFADTYFDQVTVGIDLTARDLQRRCKEQGHPWEIAKAFDHSAVVGQFVPMAELRDPQAINFHLQRNEKTVQIGDTRNLIFSFETLICYVSQFFKLQEGDLIFTGTPEGVGPIKIGDTLHGFLEGRQLLTCAVK